MNPDETRRYFLIGGSVTSAQPDPQTDGGAAEFPRDRPGRGGLVGSPTDRSKLVPGRRDLGEPPVLVEAPDLAKDHGSREPQGRDGSARRGRGRRRWARHALRLGARLRIAGRAGRGGTEEGGAPAGKVTLLRGP